MTSKTSVLARVGALAQIVAAIAALFATSVLISLVVAPLLPENLRMPIQALALWGGVLAGAIMLRFSKSSYREIGFRQPPSWLKTLGWAVVGIVASQLGGAAIMQVIHVATDWPPLQVDYIRDSIAGDTLAYVVWMVLVVWGSAGFGEELLARGFIMDRFQIVFGRARAGVILAVLGQAAIFGILHAVQGPSGLVITAYVGIVLAWVYFASGRNLWAPILAHGGIDSISLTLMYLGVPIPGLTD